MKYFIASLLAAFAAADGHEAACSATLKKQVKFVVDQIAANTISPYTKVPDPANPSTDKNWTQEQFTQYNAVKTQIGGFATAEEITDEALANAIETFEAISWLDANGDPKDVDTL